MCKIQRPRPKVRCLMGILRKTGSQIVEILQDSTLDGDSFPVSERVSFNTKKDAIINSENFEIVEETETDMPGYLFPKEVAHGEQITNIRIMKDGNEEYEVSVDEGKRIIRRKNDEIQKIII